MGKYKNPNYHKEYYRKHRKKMIEQVLNNNKSPHMKRYKNRYYKKYREWYIQYYKKWRVRHKKERSEYMRKYHLHQKENIYKIIILDLSKIKFNNNTYFRSTTIKSKDKIEKFKMKIERYFGKKGV